MNQKARGIELEVLAFDMKGFAVGASALGSPFAAGPEIVIPAGDAIYALLPPPCGTCSGTVRAAKTRAGGAAICISAFDYVLIGSDCNCSHDFLSRISRNLASSVSVSFLFGKLVEIADRPRLASAIRFTRRFLIGGTAVGYLGPPASSPSSQIAELDHRLSCLASVSAGNTRSRGVATFISVVTESSSMVALVVMQPPLLPMWYRHSWCASLIRRQERPLHTI